MSEAWGTWVIGPTIGFFVWLPFTAISLAPYTTCICELLHCFILSIECQSSDACFPVINAKRSLQVLTSWKVSSPEGNSYSASYGWVQVSHSRQAWQNGLTLKLRFLIVSEFSWIQFDFESCIMFMQFLFTGRGPSKMELGDQNVDILSTFSIYMTKGKYCYIILLRGGKCVKRWVITKVLWGIHFVVHSSHSMCLGTSYLKIPFCHFSSKLL